MASQLQISGRPSGKPKRHATTEDESSYVHAVQQRVSRVHSTQHATTGPEQAYANINASQAFYRLIDGLRKAHIDTSRIKSTHFRWLLPDDNASMGQKAVYSAMQIQPMTATRADLSKILTLEPSTADSPRTAEGHHFYIRSWAITPDELQALINSLVADQNDFEELETWQDVIQLHGKRYPILTVRYIGTCQGPKTPWGRHDEDLIRRNSGILHYFSTKLREMFPAVADAVAVDLIPAAHLDFLSRYIADDVERVLIEFFHHPSLLNRQRGGFLPAYVPAAKDTEAFTAMATQMYTNFLDNTKAASSEMKHDLASYFDRIQWYANENPNASGAAQREFSNELRERCKQAATPRQFYGLTLLIFVGREITLEDYYTANDYISGHSRSGTLARNINSRLCGLEETTANRFWASSSFEPHDFYTFVDLHHTLWRRKMQERARLDLQEYFGIVRPLISCSYSLEVNAVTLANFAHNEGLDLPRGHLWRVGRITLQHHGSSSPSGNDDAFLNIFHIDPGHDKYGSQSLELRRVFFLSMAITYVVVYEAMKIIKTHHMEQIVSTRMELCQEILTRVNKLRRKGPGKKLFDALEQAKIEYSNLIASKPALGVLPSEKQLPLFDAAGSKLLQSLGKLNGAPGSHERKAQVDQYWNKNYPDLHITYDHDPIQQEAWTAFFTKAPKDQYWLLHALTEYHDVAYVGRLLSNFRPHGSSKAKWFHDRVLVRQAAIAAGLALAQRNEVNPMRRVDKLTVQPRQLATTAQMQDLVVVVSGHYSEIRLLWQRSKKVQLELDIPVGYAKMQDLNEHRSMSFTEHGIDILDAADTPLRPSTPQGQPLASIPKASFLAYRYGQRIKELWEAVRLELGHEPEAESLGIGRDWGPGKGVDFIKSSGVPTQNDPPQRLDASFLLASFLTKHFPSSGDFQTVAKERSPRSTEDMIKFIDFVKHPDNSEHPYAKEWLAHLAKPKPDIPLLGRVLPCLVMTCRTGKGCFIESSIGEKVTRTWYELGPLKPGVADAVQTEDAAYAAQVEAALIEDPIAEQEGTAKISTEADAYAELSSSSGPMRVIKADTRKESEGQKKTRAKKRSEKAKRKAQKEGPDSDVASSPVRRKKRKMGTYEKQQEAEEGTEYAAEERQTPKRRKLKRRQPAPNEMSSDPISK